MPVSKLLKLPYGSYLMVRLDYKIICADELEAKIMRIIEMYMDDERKILYKQFLNDPKNTIEPEATVEITKDVWPAISHRLFKNDLYDQDMSENTLKRALKSLRKKNFILVRDKGLTRYEAPKYQINVDAVQEQLDLLSRIGKTEYQKLMVSKIDGIKNASHQKETPSDHQNLTASSDSRVSKIDGNSRRVYEVEERVEESTYPASESQSDDSGSVEPTRTHALSDTSQDVKGHEYDNSTRHDMLSARRTSRDSTGGSDSHPQDAAGHQGRTARAEQVAQKELANTAETAQLSTCAPAYPQRGAKVAPRPSAFVAAPLFGTQKPARPQLTEEGNNVLEWYQIIQACKVRKTDANINACNGLGEEDGMSFDNLKKAIEHWEAHSYVKERQIPIDLQKLEDPKGAFTFAKAMLVIRPNKSKPTNERKTSLVSCANMTDEEYNAYIRKGTQR